MVRRRLTIDYLGAALITGGLCVLLISVSLAGQLFPWVSGATASLAAGGVLMLGLAAVVEYARPKRSSPGAVRSR